MKIRINYGEPLGLPNKQKFWAIDPKLQCKKTHNYPIRIFPLLVVNQKVNPKKKKKKKDDDINIDAN